MVVDILLAAAIAAILLPFALGFGGAGMAMAVIAVRSILRDLVTFEDGLVHWLLDAPQRIGMNLVLGAFGAVVFYGSWAMGVAILNGLMDKLYVYLNVH